MGLNRATATNTANPKCVQRSVPTGRPYVSPGQRPGKPGTIDCQSPNEAAITMNANSTNPETHRCCTAKMNERKIERIGQGPPRWGFVVYGRTETQADGLGCHSGATLWRNRNHVAALRRNCGHVAGVRFMRFQSQRDVPMSAQASGLGNEAQLIAKAPTGRP